MNHERPVSLYLVVPYESRDRLKPLVRLILNQIIHTLTPNWPSNGRPVSPHRRPLLLMLDEFPLLGRFEVFGEALLYGRLRAACLPHGPGPHPDSRGLRHDESITSNCDTRVAFTPTRSKPGRALAADRRYYGTHRP